MCHFYVLHLHCKFARQRREWIFTEKVQLIIAIYEK